MIVNFQKLRPRAWAWAWLGDQRTLLVGAWFFAVGIDLGLKRSAWYRHFSQRCGHCGGAMVINSRRQRVLWHGACRTQGRAELHRRMKLEARRKKDDRPSLWARIFGGRPATT